MHSAKHQLYVNCEVIAQEPGSNGIFSKRDSKMNAGYDNICQLVLATHLNNMNCLEMIGRVCSADL